MSSDTTFERLRDRNSASSFFHIAHEKKIPLNVQLQLTDRCNLKCEFCYNSLTHKRDELSYDELLSILDQFRELGSLFVCLTGGEPTLHPRFFDIAQAVVDRAMALEVITNATLLSQPHFDFFERVQPKYVAVSLHGLGAESHQRLTRSEKSFQKTMDAINELSRRGVNVELRMPMTRYNYNEIHDMRALAESLGVSYRIDCNITYREDGDASSIGPRADEDQYFQFRLGEWERWLKSHKPAEVNEKLIADIDGSYLCAAGHSYCYLDSRGTLFPCPSYQRPIGSLRESSLASLWRDSDFLDQLRSMTHGQLTGCADCSDKPFCSFCPGDARLEGMDTEEGFALYGRACDEAAANRRAYEHASNTLS